MARHEEFNIKVHTLLEEYARDIIRQMKQILRKQDNNRSAPIHYAAMSKYTKCFKCIEALLHIDIEEVDDYDRFLAYFFELQMLETREERKFDPRKYKNVLADFKHLLSPNQYNMIIKDFK